VAIVVIVPDPCGLEDIPSEVPPEIATLQSKKDLTVFIGLYKSGIAVGGSGVSPLPEPPPPSLGYGMLFPLN
jgi:hypothetical protein